MDPHTPKVCIPYLARAKELASKDPVIAYWCKFMAAKVALDQLDSLDDAGKAALEDVMGDLEQSKAALAGNELVTDDNVGSAYIYNLASRVFDRADAIDRAGKATRATAKEFLAASNFFEILSIFGALETDVNEKITYAKWKASSIAKAFREGRTPTPGPANAPIVEPSSPSLPSAPTDSEMQHYNDSSEDVSRQLLGSPKQPSTEQHIQNDNIADPFKEQDEDDMLDSRFALPPAPNDDPGSPPRTLPSVPDIPTSPSLSSRNGQHPSAPPDLPDFSSFSNEDNPSSSLPAPSLPSQPPSSRQPAAPAVPRASAPVLPQPSQPYNRQAVQEEWHPEPSTVDPVTIEKAQKHAKWAISALNYEDLETARLELKKALSLLGGD